MTRDVYDDEPLTEVIPQSVSELLAESSAHPILRSPLGRPRSSVTPIAPTPAGGTAPMPRVAEIADKRSDPWLTPMRLQCAIAMALGVNLALFAGGLFALWNVEHQVQLVARCGR